jgi:hypothetical protein
VTRSAKTQSLNTNPATTTSGPIWRARSNDAASKYASPLKVAPTKCALALKVARQGGDAAEGRLVEAGDAARSPCRSRRRR